MDIWRLAAREISGSLPTLPPTSAPSLATNGALEDIDHEFIADVVGSRSLVAKWKVARHHEALWDSRHRAGLERLQGFGRRQNQRTRLMRPLLRREERTVRRMSATRLFPRWTPWELTKISAAALGLVVLLAASVASVFTLLKNTVGFADSPLSCLLCALLVATIPISGKLLLESVADEELRRRLCIGLAIATMALFMVWAFLLAKVTGGLGAPVLDLASLTSDGQSAGHQATVAVALQWSQLLLEFTASLACFAYLDLLYARHRPGQVAADPLHQLNFERLVEQAEAFDQQMSQDSDVRGNYVAMLAARKAFVSRARAAYAARKSEATKAARRELWEAWEAARVRSMNSKNN